MLGHADAIEPLYGVEYPPPKRRSCSRWMVAALVGCVGSVVITMAWIMLTNRFMQYMGMRYRAVAESDIGTCVLPSGTGMPSDCEHVDQGTCGASCCVVELAVPNIDPLEAYEALSKSLSSGGPDGRYSKKSSDKDDVQNDVPFSFSPPLPWRFTVSGKHSTAGAWSAAGIFRPGFDDTLRFSIGVASDPGPYGLTRVRMFSLSGPDSALVDFGQGYKSLALLSASLGWPKPTPTFGCGLGQAVAWKPANTSTVQLQNRDGVCLDAKQRTKNGGVVQMWGCDPTNLNQLWKLDSETGLIKNADGICLADASAGNTPGGSVVTWACDPTAKNQGWNVRARLRAPGAACAPSMPIGSRPQFDPKSGQIKARHGALCLDASERQSNGGKIVMWTCDVNNKNQQWDAHKV